MLKSKSEKSFLDFLSSSPIAFKVGVLVVIGLLMMLLSGVGGNKSDEPKEVGEEERLSEMCSLMDGVGECRVMITYKEIDGESRVYAALVLCEGGESVKVQERITSLCCSLYGIGANRVEVGQLCELK